jgi:nucleoside recognition membrane protein YjiH
VAASATRRTAGTKFLVATLVGGFFFLVPIRVDEQWTIAFDVVVTTIREEAPDAVAVYSMLVIVLATIVSILARLQPRSGWLSERRDLSSFATSLPFLAFRILGGVFAILIVFELGPPIILDDATGGLMFDTLVAAVAVIVPIGAVFITLFVAFGTLEFIGTLARPLMRPLFRVPGRGALDAVASFVGSYSVGLYVTNLMYNQSRYSAREATVIAMCFSTVSMGFFAVVTATLDLMAYFPLVFASVTLVMLLLGVILCRLPPLSTKPDDYVGEPRRETAYRGNLLRHAVREAIVRTAGAGSMPRELVRGLVDGFKLSMVILPTILAIGLIAIIVAEHTPLFEWLGRPVQPVLDLLGIPDSATIAPASLIGITEMFLPALLSVEAAIEARFFIAVLSISQLLFFSAVIPLMLELDIPIKLSDCVILFLARTIIAIPIIAGITHLVFGVMT